jgi:hypothetical protein
MTNPVMRLSVTGFFIVFENTANPVNAVNFQICNA